MSLVLDVIEKRIRQLRDAASRRRLDAATYRQRANVHEAQACELERTATTLERELALMRELPDGKDERQVAA
ncbi:MAG: hypothetical protein ACO1SV_21755 [Fimbriimonas sp.]